MTTTAPVAAPATKIPFRFHPRVFAALGADLVTNDVVAVMELVKNAYDAGARTVTVRFGGDSATTEYLEIEDDGCGMSREIIEDVWCVVATPYKADHPNIHGGSGHRRVSGEKGLGRLSAARLGDAFHMLTRAGRGPCWEVNVRWSSLTRLTDLSEGAVELRQREGGLRASGTRIRVGALKQKWTAARVDDLRSNLARLVPPFSGVEDFTLFLSSPAAGDTAPLRVEPDEFLTKPKYCIAGSVNREGDTVASYRFAPLSKGVESRENEIRLGWAQVWNGTNDRTGGGPPADSPRCGPFAFELRAWDINRDGTEEIAGRFELPKGRIRQAIRAHNGIAVYRDGILVMPKSEKARDWLGLDLRRVSKVGIRLSTNQIVGYVAITSDDNPDLRDTSDREKLTAGVALTDFERILQTIVGAFEIERDRDRSRPEQEKPMTALFEDVSPEPLVQRVQALARQGAEAAAAVPVVVAHAAKSTKAIRTIQSRLVYYSRLATVGTIAEMLVHEIRNQTTVIGRFLITMKDRLARARIERLTTQHGRAERAVSALESLADRFAPLASRSYRRGRRGSILEDRIRECLELRREGIRRLRIQCVVPDTRTAVAVDPSELDAVLLNLVTNSLYWLSGVKDRPRTIAFSVAAGAQNGRVEVRVEDSGPGIADADLERVFLPGVTRRPGGIGMGLTVASELVAAYDGRMATVSEGTGATFFFDLPRSKE